MRTSEYQFESLRDMAIANFRAIAKQYRKGDCVGDGPSFLRVSNNGVSVVIRYRVKSESGEWSGVNEYSEAL